MKNMKFMKTFKYIFDRINGIYRIQRIFVSLASIVPLVLKNPVNLVNPV